MRPIVLGILFCIALAAGVTCANKFGGAHLDLSAPLAATSAGVLALVLAAMPLRMARGADTVTVAQTGLIATVIQMLILLISGGLVLLGHMPVGSSFIYWLMAVYIISMIAIIASINGVIRATSTSKA
ncbi:MAG TPA: hypothetical protein VGG19_12600 [Tepidisphaeraceae bacterium]|jgi:hypothetical protein